MHNTLRGQQTASTAPWVARSKLRLSLDLAESSW